MLTIHPDARALIFDCDGTLADTMPMHERAWRETLIATNNPFPEGFIDGVKGMPAEQIVARYNEMLGKSLDAAAICREKSQRVFPMLAGACPLDPVANLAREHQGRLPMAVASGGTRRNVERILAATDLAQYFEIVLTADDPYDPKPAPGLFLEAARRLGVAPEFSEVFEDGETGLEAARRAGMIATDVRPFLSAGVAQ